MNDQVLCDRAGTDNITYESLLLFHCHHRKTISFPVGRKRVLYFVKSKLIPLYAFTYRNCFFSRNGNFANLKS